MIRKKLILEQDLNGESAQRTRGVQMVAKDVLNLDWETYSEVPITCGTYRYTEDKSTELLVGAYSINGGEVYQEDYTKRPFLSKYLNEALGDPEVLIRAHNAAFEWLVWEERRKHTQGGKET